MCFPLKFELISWNMDDNSKIKQEKVSRRNKFNLKSLFFMGLVSVAISRPATTKNKYPKNVVVRTKSLELITAKSNIDGIGVIQKL